MKLLTNIIIWMALACVSFALYIGSGQFNASSTGQDSRPAAIATPAATEETRDTASSDRTPKVESLAAEESERNRHHRQEAQTRGSPDFDYAPPEHQIEPDGSPDSPRRVSESTRRISESLIRSIRHLEK